MYFIRVSLHIGVRHNDEMGLYVTDYMCANSLRTNDIVAKDHKHYIQSYTLSSIFCGINAYIVVRFFLIKTGSFFISVLTQIFYLHSQLLHAEA